MKQVKMGRIGDEKSKLWQNSEGHSRVPDRAIWNFSGLTHGLEEMAVS